MRVRVCWTQRLAPVSFFSPHRKHLIEHIVRKETPKFYLRKSVLLYK